MTNSFSLEIQNSSDLISSIIDSANTYSSNALSPRSLQLYKLAWTTYLEFCRTTNVDPFGSNEKEAIVTLFAVSRSKQGFKYSGTKLYVYGILYHYRQIGFELDMRKHKVKTIFAGIRKSTPQRPNRKEPILVDDLREMIKVIPIEKKGKPYLWGYRNRALLLLAFCGAFRRSEVVSLKYEDLKFDREGIIVLLRKSKGDPDGNGIEKIIPYGSQGISCPIRTLNDWLQISGIKSGFIFPPIDHETGLINFSRHMTGLSLWHIIKTNKYLKDKRPELYGGHSLRAGFVTQAVKNGVGLDLIIRQTGHKTYKDLMAYVRRTPDFSGNAASKVGL